MNLIQKKAGSTIFHLLIKGEGDHNYFGSIAAIFDTFTAKELGVSQKRLYDFKITPEHPYENKVCTISKAEIQRKKTNRTLPKK